MVIQIISTNSPTWEHDCEEAAKNGQPFRVTDIRSTQLSVFIKWSDQYSILPTWDGNDVEFYPESKGA